MNKKWLTLIEIIVSITISTIVLSSFWLFLSSIVKSFSQADFAHEIFLDGQTLEEKLDFIWEKTQKIALKWNSPSWDFGFSYVFFSDSAEEYWFLVMWCDKNWLITSQITDFWEYSICIKNIWLWEISSAKSDINTYFSWLNKESFEEILYWKVFFFDADEVFGLPSEHLFFDIEILVWAVNLEEKNGEILEKTENFYLFNFAK